MANRRPWLAALALNLLIAAGSLLAAAQSGVVAAATPAGEHAPGAMGPRIVKPGDTLFSLAVMHGTTVSDLARTNGLDATAWLVPGRSVWVPLGLAAPTGQTKPAGPEALGPPVPVYDSVTVQDGDTFTSIADRAGISAAGLEALNGSLGDLLVPGEALRIPRPGAGAEGATGPKRIEIDVSEQRMYVWQGSRLVWNLTTSTGMSGYPTRRGAFQVQSKVDMAWSSAWQLWMPDWLGIYWAGGSENGIHALPIINGQTLWAGLLGTPISYGCVVLGTEDAHRLYRWADLGTPVEIRD